MDLKITVVAGQDLLTRLKELGENLTDLPESMEQIGQEMKRFSEDEVFRSHGGIINALWAPLSAAYDYWKTTTKGKNAPLIRGQLLVYSGAMSHGFTYEADKDTVSVGNSEDYWVYHQSGTKKMPARKLIGFNETEKQKFGGYIQDEIQKKLTK